MKKKFLENKRLHLFKQHLYQNGKVETIPVVAGRFVVENQQIYKVLFQRNSI